MTGFSGSFPSRILDHLYLGNLEHANKTDMLEQIGITRIVSVGERPLWMNPQNKFAPPAHYKFVQSIQDDGIDSLTGTLEECLHFIGKLRKIPANLQTKDFEQVKLHWSTAESVSPDQQRFVSLKWYDDCQ